MRSRWKLKIKKWRDRKSRLSTENKHHALNNFKIPSSIKVETVGNHKKLTITPPDVFSLLLNTKGTVVFICDFTDQIKQRQPQTHFHIESRDVKEVTVDALIYLLALIKNNLLNRMMHYSFTGSFPKSDAARKVYMESGFTRYVKSPFSLESKQTDKMCIEVGHGNNSDIVKQICDFVCSKLNLEKRKGTRPLYKVLIELLSNVYYHAYSKEEPLQKRWYIYAEYVDNMVHFVFLDTGSGIARTVRKKIREKIKMLVGLSLKDGKILESVFNGDFRTQTKELYRGNGLSTVFYQVIHGPFNNFRVMSGKGLCMIDKNRGITSEELEHELIGTLYTFDYIGGCINVKN